MTCQIQMTSGKREVMDRVSLTRFVDRCILFRQTILSNSENLYLCLDGLKL